MPRIFDSFGAIPLPEIQDWLRQTGVVLPSELIELWQQTGGGDIFDSETILRLARSVGFSVPTGWLDRSEIAEISGIVESLRGKPYGAFAHCFCDLR